MKTECQMSEPDYIETWTPYPVGRAISQSRINDVLSGRNPPHSREEIRAAKTTLERVMIEKGIPIPGRELP